MEKIRVLKKVECTTCGGKGYRESRFAHHKVICHVCKGFGWVHKLVPQEKQD